MSTIQYSTTIDPVIYGRATTGFERADWIALALAALDQAGVKRREHEKIVAILDEADVAVPGAQE